MSINGKEVHLGLYSNQEDAARVRDSGRVRDSVSHYLQRGAFSILNFPDKPPQPIDDDLKAKLKHFM
jgi:hypothetical protein